MAGAMILFGIPVDYQEHGLDESGGCSHYSPYYSGADFEFIAITESVIHCEANSLCKIYATSLDIKGEWRSQLLSYCKKNLIDFEEPNWYLTSYE